MSPVPLTSAQRLVRRRRRLQVLWLAAVALGLAALVFVFPWRTRRDLERCRRGYAAARSAADTLAVDRLAVDDRPPKGQRFELQRCRATRGGPDLGPVVEPRPSGVTVPEV